MRVFVLEQAKFKEMIELRDLKESLIRGAKLFETLDTQQVAKIAARLHRETFVLHDNVIREGELGEHCYLVTEDRLQLT